MYSADPVPQPTSHELLVRYCDHLQRKLREEVGYIHMPALTKYVHAGRVFPSYQNGDLCGYLLFNDFPTTDPRTHSVLPGTTRIYQAAIQYDAQRRHHGLALVDRLIERASAARYHYIDCYVTDSIPANDFWTSIGFQLIGTRPGGKRRKRILNHYRMTLPHAGVIAYDGQLTLGHWLQPCGPRLSQARAGTARELLRAHTPARDRDSF